jgi:hypothetical protein
MADNADKRQFSRHPVGLVMISMKLELPGLGEAMIDPEDVSMGGMKVVVPLKPSVGDKIQCAIEIKGIRYENGCVEVAWVQEIDSEPGAHEVGLALDMESDDRADFHEAMIEHLKDVGNLP